MRPVTMGAVPRLVPPHVVPPARTPGRLAFVRAFVRNPLLAAPRAAYEEDFVPFRWAGTRRAWITSPSLVRAVLLEQRESFRKLTQIRLLRPLLGRGILSSEGGDWRWQRHACAPMFRAQELTRFVPRFASAAEDMLARWRQAPAGSVRRIDRDMTRTTFEVISATLLPSADAAVAPAIERWIGVLQKGGGWDQLCAAINAPSWVPRPGMLARMRAIAKLRSAVAAILAERRAIARDAGAPDDLLHRLLLARDPESGQAMNDEQLVDNLLTFYLAGHETTAKALTWTLYLLARSPEWAQAARDEVERVTRGAPVRGEHVGELAIVQQVLEESMRLYPPVPIMSRQCVAATRIDGHDIEAGASLLIPIYAIHRHAKRWADPDAFDPARFSAQAATDIPRYQYMPFGAGPRICIGMSFAMLEAKAILATFLQGARFEAVPGHEPHPIARVTLVPAGGMPLRVWTR